MARARDVKRGKKSSPSGASSKPVSSVTKKVRMTEEEAARLSRVAADAGKTESEILRDGIALAEREATRRKAWDGLIKMAEESGPEPPKIYWRGK